MTIIVDVFVNQEKFSQLVEELREDRNKYVDAVSSMASKVAGVDQVFVLTDWPPEDGILLIKERDDSIARAKKELHPQVHRILEFAIKESGADRVERECVLARYIAT